MGFLVEYLTFGRAQSRSIVYNCTNLIRFYLWLAPTFDQAPIANT